MSSRVLWEKNGPDWMLDEYGRWLNQSDGPRINYPSKTAFAVVKSDSHATVWIDDEVAAFIQESIVRLGEKYPEHEILLNAYYVQRLPLGRCAERLSCGTNKASKMLNSAQMWIDSKLGDYFDLSRAERLIYTMRVKKAS